MGGGLGETHLSVSMLAKVQVSVGLNEMCNAGDLKYSSFRCDGMWTEGSR